MDTEGVGDVEENTALAADVLLVRARSSRAGSAVHRGGVSAALSGGVSPQPDVPSLAPVRAPGYQTNLVSATSTLLPRVLDQPEVFTIILTVPHHRDGVVLLAGGAAGEDPSPVVLERS